MKNKLIAMLLVTASMLGSVRAQVHSPFAADLSGAKELSSNGVDTTNLTHVRQIASSPTDALNQYAYLFLAQRGFVDVLPQLKNRLRVSIQEDIWHQSYYYLAALYVLADNEARNLANALVDTMLVHEQVGKVRFRGDQYELIIDLLLSYEDYSRYQLFKSLFGREWRPHPIASQLFFVFAQNAALRSDAFQTVKSMLSDGDDLFQIQAVRTIYRFTDFSERLVLLQQVALSGRAPKVRDAAIEYLVYEGDIQTAIRASETLIRNSIDTLFVNNAIDRLAVINSPYGLATLTSLRSVLATGPFVDRVNLALRAYMPPKPPTSESVMILIDSLISFKDQVFALNWLAETVFAADLNRDLQRARQALVSGDFVGCARSVKSFRDKIDIVYKDSLNSDPRKVTIEGWKFLYYNAQYILDRLPAIPPSPVIASLNPATASAGGFGFSLTVKGKAFVSNSALLWNGSPRITSFVADSVLQATILTSDIASAGTANVAVMNPGNDTSNVLSFTITQPPSGLSVKLISSTGMNLTGGSLQYYDGSWKDAVNNNDGTFNVNTTLSTVSLRMTYEGGSQTKSNVAVGPNVVVFQTVNTQVRLQNSQGALIDTGTVQYYYSSWKALGQTINGVASKELLPAAYTFRVTYATATNDKQQDIGVNATVVFSTVNAAVQLKNSQGNFVDQGTVHYYFNSWQAFGLTMNGQANRELLPAIYTFRMGYASATKDKQQNIGTNPTVVFNTVNASVQLKNSQGAFIDQGTVQYYFSSWKAFGQTINGVAMAELLPASYTFRMAYAAVTNDKVQDISTNSTVNFSTVLCTVTVKNTQGQPVDGAQVSYYFSSWVPIGATVGGQVTKELLPASLTFRETIGSATQNKVQNIGTNGLVEFVVQ